jgi:hypothetical protein
MQLRRNDQQGLCGSGPEPEPLLTEEERRCIYRLDRWTGPVKR